MKTATKRADELKEGDVVKIENETSARLIHVDPGCSDVMLADQYAIWYVKPDHKYTVIIEQEDSPMSYLADKDYEKTALSDVHGYNPGHPAEKSRETLGDLLRALKPEFKVDEELIEVMKAAAQRGETSWVITTSEYYEYFYGNKVKPFEEWIQREGMQVGPATRATENSDKGATREISW